MLRAVGLALWEVVTRRSNSQVERFGVHTIRSGTLSRILVSYLSFFFVHFFHSFVHFCNCQRIRISLTIAVGVPGSLYVCGEKRGGVDEKRRGHS